MEMVCDYDIKFVDKEITPFGGLSLFLKMLERCHFAEHLEMCGIPSQGSNRGYKPLQLILGLFAGVWCGASCFGHLFRGAISISQLSMNSSTKKSRGFHR